MKYYKFAVAFLLATIFASTLYAQTTRPLVVNEPAAGPLPGANNSANNLPVYPMGLAYVLTTPAATAGGTSEQFLATYALPAGGLDVVGRTIRIRAGFATAANTNSKTPKLYFGTLSLATAAITTSGASSVITMDVVKTGASTQAYSAWGLGGAAGVTPVDGVGTGSITDTAAINIRASCTDGTDSAGDCTLTTMTVEYLN